MAYYAARLAGVKWVRVEIGSHPPGSSPAPSSYEMTSSEKVVTAVKLLLLPPMERMTAGIKSSPSMTAVRAQRCSAHAGQTTSVCWIDRSGPANPTWDNTPRVPQTIVLSLVILCVFTYMFVKSPTTHDLYS